MNKPQQLASLSVDMSCLHRPGTSIQQHSHTPSLLANHLAAVFLNTPVSLLFCSFILLFCSMNEWMNDWMSEWLHPPPPRHRPVFPDSSASSACLSQRSHQPSPPVSTLHGGFFLLLPEAEPLLSREISPQSLSAKVFLNRHFSYPIHKSLLMVMRDTKGNKGRNWTGQRSTYYKSIQCVYTNNVQYKTQ